MKRVFILLLLSILLLPVVLLATQDAPALRTEITGINTDQSPTYIVTANVYDRLGQPVFGLTADNFAVVGQLADRTQIVSVENITDDALSFSVVLAIDTSSSMAIEPFERAQEAAISFINAIGPNDPVAIVAFGSDERLVQDFTTDKAALINAINNLNYGGKTALYDAGLLAVETAANADSARRAVILLSDGAEFGGRSAAGRSAALDAALRQGVPPVYTIGLGYGIDRSYLQELAAATNAEFYESPAPDELLTIYNDLAAKLRSQYVVTLNTDIPNDGQIYTLEIQVTNDQGTATASADLRSPIPVPIVTLPELPSDPISQPTDITAVIAADDPITTAEFLLDGANAATFTQPPYTLSVDPVTLAPGTHELMFNAVDENGDSGAALGFIEIAALPSNVSILGLLENEITDPQTVILDVTGQTSPVSATYSLDDGEGVTVNEVPFAFEIIPLALTPGEHTLSVDVVNQGGVTTTASQIFTVAALPPVLSITGLESGQEVAEPVDVSVAAEGQTPVTNVTITLNGQEIGNVSDTTATVTINPVDLPPGDAQLVAIASLESGQSTSQAVDFTVAALPPQVTISGIEVGETLEENRTVEVEVSGQADMASVTYLIDGNEVASQDAAPFSFEVDVLELAPGAHILAVTAEDTNGQSGNADIAFTISEGPSLTATALVPTSTQQPTDTPQPSRTPIPTANRTATAEQAALFATQTATAQIIEMMTAQAMSAADAQATINAEASATADIDATQQVSNDQATLDARATANALSTQAALAAADQQATLDARATANALSTQAALAAADQQATLDARATANALSTQAALAAADRQVTQDARATINAEMSAVAQAALDAQNTLDAQASLAAQSALDAQATRDARSTATFEAEASASAEASPTQEEIDQTQEAALTEQPTEVSQAVTPTDEGRPGGTAAPTFTPIPLTSETQGTAAQGNNILPILIFVIILVVVIVALYLIFGRRRQT